MVIGNIIYICLNIWEEAWWFSKFREGSRVRQTPEKGRRTYQPKCCGNNNKDEDNSPLMIILFTVTPFSSKWIIDGSFMPQKTISITFFIDRCTRNFYLPESQCISTPWTVFSTQDHISKPIKSQRVFD